MLSTAAIVAAGVGLVPGVANAAGQDGAKGTSGPGVAAPDLDLTGAKTQAYGEVKASSPAAKTVHPTVKGGQSAAATAPVVALQAEASSAHGVQLKVDVTSDPGTALGVLVEWGDGSSEQVGANGPTNLTRNHVYSKTGAYTVKVSLLSGPTVVGTNQLVFRTAGNEFTPHAPTRLLDTRDGTGAPRHQVPAYGTARIKVGGAAQIPAGVTAVALNVTVTNAGGAGHVRVYADGGELPTTSNVNYSVGQTVPNLVIASVGNNGYVNVYNGGDRPIDLVADVTGYFSKTAANGYTPLTPSRVVDTREGLGTGRGHVPGQGTFSTQITGRGGVPSSAKAVALNVTVTDTKEAGHLTVYPSGGAAPTASNLNFGPRHTIANSVIVPIGADGRISIRNGAWAGTHVIVDVVGYYSPESEGALVRNAPSRWFDTREMGGPLDGRAYIYGQFGDADPNITAVVTNATVTNGKDAGFLTVAPDPYSWADYENGWAGEPTPPNSSNLNWLPRQTVPNLVQATNGTHGVIDFWNMSWSSTDLIVDTFGFYAKN
ncbi:hypothetical protein ACIGD1_15780 [Streptomyces sp. NPDC085612]|uniref:hypothetical protein n=1 Tax=Streptomyces sp. NPDC085612 TaxID=3365732 RepID=UPI0037D627DE